MPVSLVGGAVGAVLLLATPSALFDAIIPWLLLLATLAVAFGQQAGLALRRLVRIGPAPLLFTQFLRYQGDDGVLLLTAAMTLAFFVRASWP